jgi:hypothetical protein
VCHVSVTVGGLAVGTGNQQGAAGHLPVDGDPQRLGVDVETGMRHSDHHSYRGGAVDQEAPLARSSAFSVMKRLKGRPGPPEQAVLTVCFPARTLSVCPSRR